MPLMPTYPPIQSITPRNILSFGPDTEAIDLGPLNVVIGPNGSGKSNLLSLFLVLQSASQDVLAPFREGGGISEWLWKGPASRNDASIEVMLRPHNVRFPELPTHLGMRYTLRIAEAGQRLEIRDEALEEERPRAPSYPEPRFYYRFQDGNPVIYRGIETEGEESLTHRRQLRRIALESFRLNQSVLSQRNDPEAYPELGYAAELFGSIRIHRDWVFGASCELRKSQPVDVRVDYLEEDFSNLGVLLSRLRTDRSFKQEFLKCLQIFLPDAEDYEITILNGLAQIFIAERYLKRATPATRLSDGTLRWLVLSTILLNPDPPPLICIEEPDLGLHPDMMPTLSALLRDASERTQLIVTTHSRELVDALSETPEAIMVCEKHEGATRLKRLDSASLSGWLEDYTLGELWSRGHVGGNRW
jgi:predicted ATPase